MQSDTNMDDHNHFRPALIDIGLIRTIFQTTLFNQSCHYFCRFFFYLKTRVFQLTALVQTAKQQTCEQNHVKQKAFSFATKINLVIHLLFICL